MKPPRTRIVCTVGPACADGATLAAMVRAGADVFRVNGAHAKADELAAWVRRIRRAGRLAEQTVSTMVDLPGTKIRLGAFKGAQSVVLKAGAKVTLVASRGGGSPTRLPIRALTDLAFGEKGQTVLMADGQVRLKVTAKDGKGLVVRVQDGGEVHEGTGVDFPGARVPTRVPTRRDRVLARAAIAAGADMLAMSFVRSAEDVARLRSLIVREGDPEMPIVVKIERLDAVERIDQILQHAGAAIVARGDLGVDAGPERVPPLQKEIINACLRAGRPALVATEMLESMVERRRPTRAEASDVAGAVFEGADAVMLSAETAIGKHPALVVRTMGRILRAAEGDSNAPYAGSSHTAPDIGRGRFDQHVVHGAVELANETGADAVAVYSRSGATAVRVSKERPRAPIHAFSASDAVCRRLTLAWGVHPHRLRGAKGTDAVVDGVMHHLRTVERIGRGARAVLVMGAPRDPAGATSQIRLLTL